MTDKELLLAISDMLDNKLSRFEKKSEFISDKIDNMGIRMNLRMDAEKQILKYDLKELLQNAHSEELYAYKEWIKFLFNDEYFIEDVDKWNIFESMHYHNKVDDSFVNWNILHKGDYLYSSECDIFAVLNGVESTLEQFSIIKNEDWINNCYKAMKDLTEVIYLIDDKNKLIEAIRDFYTGEYTYEKYELEYNEFIHYTQVCDAPAFAVKVMAERFDIDFWDIWSEVNDVVHRIFKKRRYELT